jgi:hypothetical protein
MNKSIVVFIVFLILFAIIRSVISDTSSSYDSSDSSSSSDNPVITYCSTGQCSPACIVPIGYTYNPTGGTQLVPNAFRGGCELPLQLLGSTFDGTLYEWRGTTRGVSKWSISRLDGLSNGITIITWGSDRNDGLGLANKSTVEQCTGYGPIINKNNPNDYSAGWETGVIYMSDKSNEDILSYIKFTFIHIFKIDLDSYGKPYKLRMWEALIEDEQKSYEYTNQLKNNIGAKLLFGDTGEYKTNATKDLYIPQTDINAIYYIETFYDSTRGIDVPDSSRWVKNTLEYGSLSQGVVPS